MNHLKKLFSEMEIDIKLAILSSLAGLGIVIVSEYYSLNRTQIGLAVLLSSLIYFFFREKLILGKDIGVSMGIHAPLQKVLIIFFIIFSTISLISTYSQLYHRPFIFFIFIVIACIVLSMQIFILDLKKYAWLILLEIFLVSMYIRASVFFEYPTVYGNDPFYHIDLIRIINIEHHLPPSNEYVYSNFPVIHIETVITKLLAGLNYKDSFFIISIIEVIGTVFVYLIVKELFNVQTGLLATLILNISDHHIYWGFWIIPMTLGVVFYMMISYLVFRYSTTKNKMNYKFILIFLSVVVTLTHTVTAFITLIVLLSFFTFKIFNSIYNKEKIQVNKVAISYKFVLFFSIFMIFYWMNAFSPTDDSLFSSMLSSAKTALTTMDVGSVGPVTSSFKFSRETMMLNDLGYMILLFFSILGILMAFKTKDIRTFLLIGAAFILFSFVYIPALAGTNFLLPGRWFVFIYVLITPFAGLSVFSVLNSMKCSNTKKFLSCSLIFFLLVFFMITSPSTSNSDSPLYAKELGGRHGMLQSEVKAANFVNIVYSGLVSKNQEYQLIRKSKLTPEIKVGPLSPEEEKTYNKGLIAVRKYDLKEGFTTPLFGRKGKLIEVILPTKQFYSHIEGTECYKIYENNEVQLYLNRDFSKED